MDFSRTARCCHTLGRIALISGLILACPGLPPRAEIMDSTICICVLTDMTGAGANASGSVAAAGLAGEDTAALLPGMTIEVLGVHHGNKAASAVARDWTSNGAVNVVADVPVSAAGLAGCRAGGMEAPAVTAALRRTPPDDTAINAGMARPGGRVTHELCLFQVSTPAQSSGTWDKYRLVRRIPAAEAFRLLSDEGCPLAQ